MAKLRSPCKMPPPYQEMMEAMEEAQTKQGIVEGIASMERGEGEPAEAVFARLRKKHGFKMRG